MDKITQRFLQDVAAIILILLISVWAYIVYAAPGILVGGSLAITVWVAADVILFRK